MTIRSALSKLLTIILRLWGVDTTRTPLKDRDSGAHHFARAMAPRIYTRNGVRVSISHHGALGDAHSGYVPRKDD